MSKTLAEQLARFGFKPKAADAIPDPEGFDNETVNAPEVAEETKVEEVVEAEAPKAEEAPAEVKTEEASKTETVEEAAPAQVETSVVAAVETTSTVTGPVKKSPKSISRMRITNEEADIDITQIGEVKPISNRGLRKFREDTFGKNSLDEVPSEYIVDGVLAKSTGFPCVWEEGGADMASGYALLVADKDGNKKAPVLCLHDKDVSNGKHALIRVVEGDLILLGVMKQLDETQMCCIVGSVTRIETKDGRALIAVSPALCAQATSDDPEVQYTDDSLAFIDAGHPLLQAGMERVQERFCHEPKYVRAYVPYKFNKIEQVIGGKVGAASKHENVLVTTVLNINKDSQGRDCIFIYIVGCVFNNAKEVLSSQGGRFFYGRTKILPGETFTYIDDRDKFLTYSQALTQMTLRGKKWIAETVKRVTV